MMLRRLHHHLVLSSGLQKARTTYQKLAYEMPSLSLGKNMETYIDGMLGKTKVGAHHEDLKASFDLMMKYRIELNPFKCVFGLKVGSY